MNYDVIIIGAGPGGIFSAYELKKLKPNLTIGVFELGKSLEKRKCPVINGAKNCVNCKVCSIMSGFGGAGAFSDGKYNITNDFGGELHEHIGKERAIELMEYVDSINLEFGGKGKKLYSTKNTKLKTLCANNNLKLLDAQVRHLGTDGGQVVLQNLFSHLKNGVDFYFETPVNKIEKIKNGYKVITEKTEFTSSKLIVSVGRSGSNFHILERHGEISLESKRFSVHTELGTASADLVAKHYERLGSAASGIGIHVHVKGKGDSLVHKVDASGRVDALWHVFVLGNVINLDAGIIGRVETHISYFDCLAGIPHLII